MYAQHEPDLVPHLAGLDVADRAAAMRDPAPGTDGR
jgi:hypothetical protein